MTFQKGQSGNPAGRPPGARGKASIFAEGLFQGAAEAIIGMAIEKAKEGDIWNKHKISASPSIAEVRTGGPNRRSGP